MDRKRFAELEYIADSIMMEKYMPLPMKKKADIMEGLGLGNLSAANFFSAVTNSIKEFFARNWDNNNKLASLMSLAAYGGLALIPMPWNIIIDAALELFDINLTTLFKKIVDFLKGVIQGGGKLSPSAVDIFAGSVLGGSSQADDGENLTAEAVYEQSEKIFKKMNVVYKQCEASALKSFGGLTKDAIKLALGPVSKSVIFSFLKKIIKFIVKGIVIGIMGALGKKVVQTVAPGVADKMKEVGKGLGLSSTPAYQTKLVPSGFGTEIQGDDWTEKVPQSAITNTILGWAVRVYPELEKYQAKLRDVANASPKFNELLEAIRDENENNPQKTTTYIPMKIKGMRIKSITDVVNYFIQDVARQLGV